MASPSASIPCASPSPLPSLPCHHRAETNKKKKKKAARSNKVLDVGANIFVGNLDPEVDEKLLYDTFSAFGVIITTPKVSLLLDLLLISDLTHCTKDHARSRQWRVERLWIHQF